MWTYLSLRIGKKRSVPLMIYLLGTVYILSFVIIIIYIFYIIQEQLLMCLASPPKVTILRLNNCCTNIEDALKSLQLYLEVCLLYCLSGRLHHVYCIYILLYLC